jgi:hypothetical protein
MNRALWTIIIEIIKTAMMVLMITRGKDRESSKYGAPYISPKEVARLVFKTAIMQSVVINKKERHLAHLIVKN